MILELAIFTPTDLLHLSGVNRAFRSILHCKVSSGIWARFIWDVLAKVKRGMNQIEMLGHFLERSGEASFMALIRPGNKDFEQPLSLICREADRWSSLYVCHDSWLEDNVDEVVAQFHRLGIQDLNLEKLTNIAFERVHPLICAIYQQIKWSTPNLHQVTFDDTPVYAVHPAKTARSAKPRAVLHRR